MYSDDDLDAAVTAGLLKPGDVEGFRRFVATRRTGTAVEHESFKLLSGFNDIFITIATSITMFALYRLMGPYSAGVIAVASWGLAEYFTRRRRAPLTSILLLFFFVGGVFLLLFKLTGGTWGPKDGSDGMTELSTALTAASLAAAGTGIATYAHWRRFQVPVTIAIAVLVALVMAGTLLMLAVKPLRDHLLVLILLAGFIAFAVAMAWDMRDPLRGGRASDVAFWLHLLAAPLIIHPLFNMLGLDKGEGGMAAMVGGLGIYLALSVVSLIIDRRALLVSALVYVIYAMSGLMSIFAQGGLRFAIAALLIGSALLLLSAKWEAGRRLALRLVPEAVRIRVPPARVQEVG